MIRKKPARAGEIDPGSLTNARRALQPEWIPPQLAKLVSEAPDGERWLHEIKYDGYRFLAVLQGKKVNLITRNNKDWTARFPRVAEAVAALPVKNGIFDGEVVALNPNGISDFQALQNALQADRETNIHYYVFDLPYCDGYDLTGAPLLERKELLARILSADKAERIHYSDHVRGDGPSVLDEACKMRLEGIICKRVDSRYESRRSWSWLKVKCVSEQEFVIGGYTDPRGSRTGFGALLLGYYNKKGELVYCGRVGTGFNTETLRTLCKQLKALEGKDTPFANPPTGADARGVHWVAPKLVGQIKYTNMTSDGILRHPSFEGLRADKPAEKVVLEVPQSLKKTLGSTNNSHKKAHRSAKASTRSESQTSSTNVSHPERVLFPDSKITKGELASYYQLVGETMLPFVTNRPLMLVRCPEGVGTTCFHQKHPSMEKIPPGLHGVPIREEKETATHMVLDNAAGLIALTQMSVLEIHTWGSKADDIEHPDRIIFDLDPGDGVKWTEVIDATRQVRERLEAMGLKSFAKTSGSKGLHVMVPIRPSANWDQVKGFAMALAMEMVQDDPANFVGKMTKSIRGGKIYIDYLRNGRGATCVAAYSTRAKPGAPVSVPVSWEALGRVKSAAAFTLRTVDSWLEDARNAWPGYFKTRQTLSSKLLQKFGLG